MRALSRLPPQPTPVPVGRRGAIAESISVVRTGRGLSVETAQKAGEQSLLRVGGASQLQQNPALLESRECL